MRSIRTRVARIERAKGQARAKSDAQHHRLMHLICGALVREQAGIDNVRPEHTDPETFRYIQETLAWARGDYAEAERLADLNSDKQVPPPHGMTWKEQMLLVREVLDRCADKATDEIERVRAAIDAAGEWSNAATRGASRPRVHPARRFPDR